MGGIAGKSAITLFVIALLVAGQLGLFSALGMEQPTQIAFVLLLIGATLWISEVVPLSVTSLIILFLCRVWLLGVVNEGDGDLSASYFLSPFFSDIILLFLGGFALSSALHKYKIDEDLARRIIRKTGHSVPLLIISIMGVTAFLSMWLSNTATTAMMLALCIPVASRLPAGDGYRKAIILCIPLAANVGGMGTPIGTPPNAIAMEYMRAAGIAPSFGKWIILGAPAVIGMLIFLWLLLLVIFRGKSKGIQVDLEAMDSVYSPQALFVIGITLLTVLGWLSTSWHGLTSGTVALVPVLVLFGTRMLNTADIRSLSWDVLLVMGGGLCLGRAVSAGGLADWFLARLALDGADALTLAIFFGIAACIMSSMMSNTATANLVMPIIVGFGSESLPPVLVGIAFSCSLAMALPISTPPNALAFGTEQLSVKDMFRPGLIGTLAGLALTYSIGWWWWGLLGLY